MSTFTDPTTNAVSCLTVSHAKFQWIWRKIRIEAPNLLWSVILPICRSQLPLQMTVGPISLGHAWLIEKGTASKVQFLHAPLRGQSTQQFPLTLPILLCILDHVNIRSPTCYITSCLTSLSHMMGNLIII